MVFNILTVLALCWIVWLVFSVQRVLKVQGLPLEKSNLSVSTKLDDVRILSKEALEISKATHTLVNNNMQIALTLSLQDKKLLVADKQKILEYVKLGASKDGVKLAEESVEAAIRAREEAERLLNEHIVKQSIVDQQYARRQKEGV